MEQISVTEAAEKKGCSRQAVHDAIKAGKIDSNKVGNFLIILVDGKFGKWNPNPERQQIGRDSQKTDS